jgi:hypothetical protein
MYPGQEFKMIKLREAYEHNGSWGLREITINPAHIVAIREDGYAARALNENRMPDGLSRNITFSRIYLNSGQSSLEIVVAESPEMVEAKINNMRRLLKG